MVTTGDPHDAGTMSITTGESDDVIVRLAGEIDISNVDAFRRDILAAIIPSGDVVFDLSAVDFMDTSGIALLIDVTNAASSVVIREPSRQVRRVIEASGLTGVLRVVP